MDTCHDQSGAASLRRDREPRRVRVFTANIASNDVTVIDAAARCTSLDALRPASPPYAVTYEPGREAVGEGSRAFGEFMASGPVAPTAPMK